MKGEMEEKEMISAKEYERRQFETLVRLVPVVLCVSALVVMLKTHQSTSYGTLDYSNAGGFRYLAYANGICAGISLISAFSSAVCWSCNYNLFRAWVVFLLDQILTCMMLAAGAVATELVYLAKEGDEKGKGVHPVLFQPRIMAYKITKGLAELFLLLLFPS